MRIYLAGMTQTGFVWRGNSQSENVTISEKARETYPWDLESYHYIGKNRHAPEYFREKKKTIFLDSGAFSMFTQGINVNLEEYANYLKANADWIHVASNIDAIGKGREADSYANQKALEKMGVSICPVHHARDDDKWLERYIADGYDYIFLGGMVPESTKYLFQWLDRLWDRYLVNKDGTPKLKVHGFGLTTMELIRRYPWFSVDSTTWVIIGRYGFVWVDLPNGVNLKMTISSESPTKHKLNGHIDTLAPALRNAVYARIEELGFTVDQLRHNYGWRDVWNIEFFRRLMDKPDPVFVRREITLFD
jgi:hypothetical protein